MQQRSSGLLAQRMNVGAGSPSDCGDLALPLRGIFAPRGCVRRFAVLPPPPTNKEPRGDIGFGISETKNENKE